MTRKHFDSIANTLNFRFRAEAAEGGDPDAVLRTAADLADWFRTVNPSFDRERFLAAVEAGPKQPKAVKA